MHVSSTEKAGGDAFGAILTELRALIPRALIDGPGWERLLGRVGELPGAEAAFRCGFEFRLDEAAPAADFFIVLGPGPALTEHYIRQGKAVTPGSAAAALARYLVRHRQSDSSETGWTIGTILEYDVAEVRPGQHPAPGVFLKLRRTRRPDRASHHHCVPRVLTATLAQAVGWTEDTGEQDAVERVFRTLPASAEVVHMGALPGRAPRAIRLIIQGIEAADLPALLKRLGWRGSIRTVAAVLTGLRDRLPRFRLSVDVAAQGLSPRLGLEMYLEGESGREFENWLTTGRSDWRPVVERLTERGWCLPEKAQGLLAWCALDRVYDRKGVFLVYKGINHVKLTIEDNGVHAKAYAGLRFAPLQPSA
jgi:hypothetical protein